MPKIEKVRRLTGGALSFLSMSTSCRCCTPCEWPQQVRVIRWQKQAGWPTRRKEEELGEDRGEQWVKDRGEEYCG
jgi:hypothetical protein